MYIMPLVAFPADWGSPRSYTQKIRAKLEAKLSPWLYRWVDSVCRKLPGILRKNSDQQCSLFMHRVKTGLKTEGQPIECLMVLTADSDGPTQALMIVGPALFVDEHQTDIQRQLSTQLQRPGINATIAQNGR
jgi:hypothetical protein